MMDALLPYMLLAVLLCVLWVAMALGRMPVDRAPEPTWNRTVFGPSAFWVLSTEATTIKWVKEGEWLPDYEPSLDRWADDGGQQP